MNERQLALLWRALGWTGVLAVAVVSLIPVPEEPVARLGGDKLLHLAGYALLAAWFAQLHREPPARLWIFGGLLLLGAGLEVAQGLVPWRSMEGWDVLADAAGAALGLLLTWGPGGRLLERVAGWHAD